MLNLLLVLWEYLKVNFLKVPSYSLNLQTNWKHNTRPIMVKSGDWFPISVRKVQLVWQLSLRPPLNYIFAINFLIKTRILCKQDKMFTNYHKGIWVRSGPLLLVSYLDQWRNQYMQSSTSCLSEGKGGRLLAGNK